MRWQMKTGEGDGRRVVSTVYMTPADYKCNMSQFVATAMI